MQIDPQMSLAEIVETIPGVLYRISTVGENDFRFTYLSPQASACFDIDIATALENPKVFTKNLPDEDLAKCYELMLESARDLSPLHLVFRYQLSAGVKWFACQSLPMQDREGRVQWTGQFTDITRQKEFELSLLRSQTLFKAAQELLQLGYWDLDLASGKITWSPEVFAIHGLDLAAGEPDMQSLAKFYVPQDFALLEAAAQRAIKTGESYRFDLRIIYGQTREVRHVAATGGVLRNPVTQVVERLFGTIFDITHRKQLEETLESARAAAEASVQAKSNFLATMSHELRTPLNGIVGMTSLLRKSNLDPRQLEYCETIQQSTEALVAVVNDILDWSKIEAGKIQLEKLGFDLVALVRGVTDILRPMADAKGIELGIVIQGGRLPAVVGDPARLRQVLLNLGANAIKFTEQGSVNIRVLPLASERGQLPIRIEVVDTGIGITPQQIKRLFERFSQADASTTRRFGGTGLGLAISKSLVELMGGEIGVLSQAGEGSTFWIKLHMPVEILEQSVASVQSIHQETEATVPLKILIAEDGLVNQRIATLVLEQAGHHPEIADDGLVALNKALTGNYDLILMDCQMPEMDGYESTRRMRAEMVRRVPIIGLTASALMDDRRGCMEAGMDDFLAKPYRAEELLEIVKRWSKLKS